MKSYIQGSVSFILGLSCLVATSLSQQSENVVLPEYNICDSTNPYNVYLPSPGSATQVYANWTYNVSNSSSINCLMYFTTCKNCYIQVHAATPFGGSCQKEMQNNYWDDDYDYSCVPGCANFFLFDASYKNQTSRIISDSNAAQSYKTESSQLNIIACGINYNRNITMRLFITVQEKIQIFLLSPKMAMTTSTFPITSPFFPSAYAKNGEFYTFQFKSYSPSQQSIEVIFDDWSLTYKSYLQFQNYDIFTKVTGSDLRPYIYTKSQHLNVTFYTGELYPSSSNYLGFRAVVQFSYSYQPSLMINDCDKIVSSEGGFITWNATGTWNRDCIWIIKKATDYNGVSLRVIQYNSHPSLYRSFNSLEIRDGITSEASLVLSVMPNDPSFIGLQYSSNGFYIRLRGTYSPRDSVLLSYVMHRSDCDNYRGYYKCENSLCISSTLKCDGADNCGDNSDESSTMCGYGTSRTTSSNYPISIGVIIPLVVSVFLIIIMCLLIIFIRRCRRINSAARRGRPPGVLPPQNRGRRHRRHNRDVQMSVTLSSGEHPPSYDEVLQNTPIGYLNMAFTWSQHGNIAQPPSYEEAVSPTSVQQNGSIVITATTSNNVCHSETNTSQQQQSSSTLLTTSISASLDPRADVSSSSSSEDVGDHYHQLDMSSSSDSSAESGNLMTANMRNLEQSRSTSNLNKVNKNSDGSSNSHGAVKHVSDTSGTQVVLENPSSGKLNLNIHENTKFENGQWMGESTRRKSLNAELGTQHHIEARNKYRSSEDIRNVSDNRGNQNPHSLERRRDGRKTESENHSSRRNDDFEENEKDRRQGRGRYESHQKHRGRYSNNSSNRDVSQATGNDRFTGRNSKVTESSRSQSCFDLSSIDEERRLPDARGTRLRDEDKRFSYAGAGDVSLTQGSLDPFYNSRGLIREKHIEHLDKYASQSYDNIRDDYRVRGNRYQDREAADEYDDRVHDRRHIRSPDHGAYFPRSKRDKSDLRSDGPHSFLAPVRENTSDEPNEAYKLNDASKHMKNESRVTDEKYQDNISKGNNTKSKIPYNRSSSTSRPGSSHAQSIVDQKTTSHDARHPNTAHLASSSLPKELRPSNVATLIQGPQSLYTENQKQLPQSQNIRRYQEPQNSKQNFKIQNSNQNSSNSYGSTTPSESQDGFKHSQNPSDVRRYSENIDQDHKNIPQSDHNQERTVPKPSLRARFQTTQMTEKKYQKPCPKLLVSPTFKLHKNQLRPQDLVLRNGKILMPPGQNLLHPMTNGQIILLIVDTHIIDHYLLQDIVIQTPQLNSKLIILGDQDTTLSQGGNSKILTE